MNEKFRKIITIALLFVSFMQVKLLLAEETNSSVNKAELNADEIMTKNYYSGKIQKINKTVSMQLIDKNSKIRERIIKVTLALQENGIDSNMIVKFEEPADVKGTGFLQHEHFDAEDDLWIYLPALHKTRRLIASNKKDSFLGSDFAYGDMLPPKVSLYKHKLIGSETINGKDCYRIESRPVNETITRDYGYALKQYWIDKESFHEVKVVYFDTEERLLKTQLISGIELIDVDLNRWSASLREIENHQTEHKTIVKAKDFTTDVDISSQTFTVRTLEWL